MPRLAASLWIAAPPEMVFRVVEAPDRPLLPSGGPRLLVLDPPGQAGARYRWEFRRLGLAFRLESAVTEYEPGRRICFRSTAGWDAEALVDLVPEGEGCRLSLHMRYQFPVPLRLLIPGVLIRLGVWHGMNQVKAMAERSAPAAKASCPPGFS